MSYGLRLDYNSLWGLEGWLWDLAQDVRLKGSGSRVCALKGDLWQRKAASKSVSECVDALHETLNPKP